MTSRCLTPQDQRRPAPHVTIQNKVTPAMARETLSGAEAMEPPTPIRAVGMDLHRYLGGPCVPMHQVSCVGA
jgi:hypothetical protein